MAMIGVRILYTSGLNQTLHCQRETAQQQNIQCSLYDTWLSWNLSKQAHITQVQTVHIDEYCHDLAEGCEYTLELHGDAIPDVVGITTHNHDHARADRQTIAEFLENPQQKAVEVGGRINATNIFGVLFGLGLTLFFSFILFVVLFHERIHRQASARWQPEELDE